MAPTRCGEGGVSQGCPEKRNRRDRCVRAHVVTEPDESQIPGDQRHRTRGWPSAAESSTASGRSVSSLVRPPSPDGAQCLGEAICLPQSPTFQVRPVPSTSQNRVRPSQAPCTGWFSEPPDLPGRPSGPGPGLGPALRVRAPVAFSVPDAVFLLRCEAEPVSIPNCTLMNVVFCWNFTESYRKTARLGLRGGMCGAEFLFELLRSELMRTEKKSKSISI